MAETASKPETAKVVALLGGEGVFRRKVGGDDDVREALREGFPFAAFATLLRVLEIRPRDLAAILGVATRTLARRKASRRLSSIESDRLYRVARIALMAADVLGSTADGRAWLHRENRALGGRVPLTLLDTEVGARQVEEVLLRIRHGIHS